MNASKTGACSACLGRTARLARLARRLPGWRGPSPALAPPCGRCGAEVRPPLVTTAPSRRRLLLQNSSSGVVAVQQPGIALSNCRPVPRPQAPSTPYPAPCSCQPRQRTGPDKRHRRTAAPQAGPPWRAVCALPRKCAPRPLRPLHWWVALGARTRGAPVRDPVASTAACGSPELAGCGAAPCRLHVPGHCLYALQPDE